MVLTLTAILTGCSKSDNSNLEHLLGTVPADAGAVAIADLPSMLKDAGCKIGSDGAVTLTPELAKAMKQNRDIAWLATALEKNETGIMAAPMVYFTEGDVFYITGLVDDTKKFRQMVTEQQGETFSDEQGVGICGYFAVKGNQFWYSRSSLGAKEINRFTGLDEKRSFLSNDACERIVENENDIRGIFDLTTFLRMTGAGNPAIAVVSSTLFKNPENVFFNVEFDKGEVEVEVNILDSKLNNAKFLLPVETIDEKTVELLGETADAVFAFNLNKNLKKKLSDFQQFLPGDLLPLLAPVDGTIAYANNHVDHNLRWVVQTDGSNATPLVTEFTKMGATLSQEGNTLIFNEGKVSGELLVKECADELDDAFFGMVISPYQMALLMGMPASDSFAEETAVLPETTTIPAYLKDVRSFTLLLEPSGNSLTVKATLRLNDKSAPSLPAFLTLLR